MPKTQAPVSVVIPAFNAEQFVAQAIASILGQTFPPAEIVVIDDGSTDGTGAVAAAFAGVRVVRKENGGPGSARNRGVETCSQPFIAFLDADDLWTSGKLEVQMEALARQETPALIFGAALEFRDTDLDDMPRPLGRALECNLPGALLTRKETLVEIGPFREDRQIGDVLDWYARALDIGVAVVMLEDVVLWRRLHPNNLGRTSKDPAGDYLGILRDIILRRRSGS